MGYRMQFDFDSGGLMDIPEIIRDIDCTINTKVIYGGPIKPIYGNNIQISPQYKGRTETSHDKRNYLANLLPLETYSKIIVLFSSGKDCLGCVLHLLELGVPKDKIELWHHLIDKGSDKKMDHPVTLPYAKAFAKALGIRLRFSWREGGFWSEVFRLGSSAPVSFEDAGGITTVESKLWQRTIELKALMEQAELEDNLDMLETCFNELKQIGYRMKLPAKVSDLSTRFCSAYLKIMVGNVAIIHSEETKRDCKILMVSGERRGESHNRRVYNECEKHGTNAETRNNRTVHVWRPLIDWSLRDVWEKIKRFRINPNPLYRVGLNRVSCALCIFNGPSQWAGVKELYGSGEGSIFQQIVDAEKELGFTLDNKVDINTFIGDAVSCIDHSNLLALEQVMKGIFYPEDVFVPLGQDWEFPAGAFRGTEGGPC
ncbi:phosphoadenosine phosphosulfate reductase domain-containing protein [Paenibacillus agricola]|nr:phosphoadenosine phosphosulfate reductase family protein [Paenibacillus agricola]